MPAQRMQVSRFLSLVALMSVACLTDGCASSKPPVEEFTSAQLGIIDTYVRSSVPDARWSDEPGIIVGGWGDAYHGLVRIGTDDLPELAADERALLLLYNSRTTPDQQPADLMVAVLTSPFAEDINWNGAALLTSQPTGGVRVGGYDAWTEIDVSEAVRAWQGGAPNNGLLLIPTTTDNRFDVFVSSESPDTQHQPRLRIVRPPQ